MNLICFSEKTLPKQPGSNKKIARVSFSKTGLITFSQQACNVIGLKPGTKLTLAQDENEPINWYFFIDPNGFEIRKGYNKSSLVFNHKELVHTFIEAIGRNIDSTYNFLIAGKPTVLEDTKTKYWGILI